jgi:DNA-binding Lrp family transcriptional regulator
MWWLILASAFVLIKVDDDAVEEVMNSLEAMPEVNEAYAVAGMYDIFSKVHTDEMTELQEFVSSKIDKLDRVDTTLTLIIIDPEPEESKAGTLDTR